MRSLSARLLLLTIAFVMVAEVLIFAPSVARFRLNWLEDRIEAGQLAVLAIEEVPDNMVSPELARELLFRAGVHGIVAHRPSGVKLMVGEDMPPTVDATVDLRRVGFFEAIGDSIAALLRHQPRTLRIVAAPAKDPSMVVEVLLSEAPMRDEMAAFGLRILQLSLFISLITAALVYLALQWMLVRPMRRLASAMMAFRDDPEDASRVIVPERRRDEVGVAQRELAQLQETVRQALAQRAHLAALGTAVSKINHDLRGMLSTARLLSDSLAESAAPEVRRVVPRLLDALDRAVALCTRTLDFTREGAPPLETRRFPLAGLVEDLRTALGLGDGSPHLRNGVPPGFIVEADRAQLFRVLFNLARNAIEAGAENVEIAAAAETGTAVVEVRDDGPGLPPKARANLFRPFAGSARPGGTGLGLAVAREIVRAHGGEIALEHSTAEGTLFRLVLPHRAASLAA